MTDPRAQITDLQNQIIRLTRELEACRKQQRSRKEHNLFFAVLDVALRNWPERYPVQFDGDTEALRAWVLIEAGWTMPIDVDLTTFLSESGGDTTERIAVAIVAAIRSQSKGRFGMRMYRRETGVLIVLPRSISRAEMKTKAFREAATRVYEILSEITGIPDMPAAVKSNAYQEA